VATDQETQRTERVSGVDPAARRPDAFLSYSRRDGEAAVRLAELLAERGKDVWVDQQDIPASSRWRDELARAIEVSDAVIALVTPAWLASENCRQEMEHADAAGKRIVPVLGAPVDRVPDALAARQWVELPAGTDWSAPVERILDAIETDLPYVRAHARYLEETQRWTAAGHDRGFLLRGQELRAAEDWLATRSERREPRPTTEQIGFIQSSRKDATRRQRILVGSVAIAAAIAIVLALVALVQRNTAVDREQTARSRELAAVSEVRRASDPEAALRLAAQGLDVKVTDQAEIALRRGIAASPLLARLGSAGKEVDSAGITPDGAWVIAAGKDGLVRAVGVADGGTRWSWTGASGRQSLAVSRRGDEVAVGQGSAVQVLRVADGVPLERYEVRRDGDLATGVIAPDGSRVAAVSADLDSLTASAGLWARGAAAPLADLGAGDFPQQPTFSRDGSLVAIPYGSGVARVWDGRTGALVHTLSGHAGVVNQVTFDPTGRWIATASQDGTARLWSTATGRQVGVLRDDQQAAVRFVRFSPDGALVAAGGDGGAVAVWRVPSGRRLATLEGHTDAVEQGEFLDRRTLVTGSLDGSGRVWDVARGRAAGVLLGHGLGVRVAPLARADHVLTVGDEGTARVWRLPQAQTVVIDERGATARLSLADDGRLLTTSNPNELLAGLWALDGGGAATRRAGSEGSIDADAWAGGAVLSTADAGLQLLPPTGEPARALGPGQSYFTARIDPTGARVAARAFTGAVDLYDTATGGRISSYPRAGVLGVIQDLAFSRDGSRLAFAESGGPLRVVDAATGERVASVPAPEAASLPAFAIDAAGRRVFRLHYGFPAARPSIVDVDTGAATALSADPPKSIDAAAFSRDGTELLTAGGGAAQVWDTTTGGLREELARVQGDTSTAAYSADDRLVVTGHDDGIVRVWDRATSALLGEYDAGSGGVAQVATGFGGTRIFAVGADSTLRMFTCDACAPEASLVDLARRHVAFGDLDAP
jgi:WD40 repeat protein